jgi:hypothetical protein
VDGAAREILPHLLLRRLVEIDQGKPRIRLHAMIRFEDRHRAPDLLGAERIERVAVMLTARRTGKGQTRDDDRDSTCHRDPDRIAALNVACH